MGGEETGGVGALVCMYIYMVGDVVDVCVSETYVCISNAPKGKARQRNAVPRFVMRDDHRPFPTLDPQHVCMDACRYHMYRTYIHTYVHTCINSIALVCM